MAGYPEKRKTNKKQNLSDSLSEEIHICLGNQGFVYATFLDITLFQIGPQLTAS